MGACNPSRALLPLLHCTTPRLYGPRVHGPDRDGACAVEADLWQHSTARWGPWRQKRGKARKGRAKGKNGEGKGLRAAEGERERESHAACALQ